MTVILSAQTPPPKNSDSDKDLVTIHYHRYDGDYTELGFWTWDAYEAKTPEDQVLRPSGEDDFGKILYLDTSVYGIYSNPKRIGFIPRLRNDWNYKDGADRFWTKELGTEIWLVGNDPNIYTSEPDISPKIQFAKIDDGRLITVRFTHPVDFEQTPIDSFSVSDPEGNPIDISDITKASNFEVAITTQQDLKTNHDYSVIVEGFSPAITMLGDILFQKDLYYTDKELGAVYTPQKTTFRLFSPTARKAWVVLYDNLTGDEGREELTMNDMGKGLWEAVVDGDLHGRHYMVKVDADGPATNVEVPDIWAKNTTGRHARPQIVDPRRYDPEGFRDYAKPATIENPTDAVVWEVSVRDFTRDESSGVPAELRGKFKGATLRGTTVPGTDIKTGIDYLVELGVTHVQILPIQDFDNREDDDEYNWGYMTTNFNSPDGWFASEIGDASRIKEFKELVQAFHEAGIRVIMDVVYNHTAPTATFESIAPGYYHRLRPDGSFWNGSGTGNEFNSEAPMARQFIVDSCRYWMEEYRVDGFRFDLMGLVDVETMKQVKQAALEVDPNALVYGEPWAGGQSGLDQLTDKVRSSDNGLGAFNDHFRNDIKGPPDGTEPGYVYDGRNRDGVIRGLRASINDWSDSPTYSLQYVTCHDNLALWDKFLASVPGATDEEMIRMNQLSLGILAVSQGIMFLHAASEFGYEKQGEHNSYNKPDSVNSIKWDRRSEYAEIENFVREMIEIRKKHPMFRLASKSEVEERTFILPQDKDHPHVIRYHISGKGLEGETWDKALVIINPTGIAEVELPEGEWTIQASNVRDAIGETVSKTIQLNKKELVVLAN